MVSVTSPVMFPPPNLQPPSLCLYLSSSACMVAGPLRGELSFPGKQLRLTRRGRGGEDEGANTPSPCPHFWGRKWRPVPPINVHLLLLFPLFLHLSTSSAKLMPSERGCCLARRSPSGQLLVEENQWEGGHCFGVNIAPGFFVSKAFEI